MQGGNITSKNVGVLSVSVEKNFSKNRVFHQKMQGALYLYPLSPPELIDSIQTKKAIGN